MPLNSKTDREVLRKHLVESLTGQNAHLTFDKAVEGLPLEFINKKVEGVPHSCWDLVEHMRIAQWDILDFIENPSYQEMPWPEGYWPKQEADPSMWQKAVTGFLEDREKLVTMVQDVSVDLFAPIAHAPDYTVFREITILANHHSYHTGQLLLLRRALQVWP